MEGIPEREKNRDQSFLVLENKTTLLSNEAVHGTAARLRFRLNVKRPIRAAAETAWYGRPLGKSV
jgi:hypothetical protein